MQCFHWIHCVWLQLKALKATVRASDRNLPVGTEKFLSCFLSSVLQKKNNGLSIKDVRSQERFVQYGILRTGGFFRCGRPHFLVKNTSDFSKFMVCPHGQRRRGVEQCGHFANKGGRFSRFCADVIYGRPKIFTALIHVFFFFGRNTIMFSKKGFRWGFPECFNSFANTKSGCFGLSVSATPRLGYNIPSVLLRGPGNGTAPPSNQSRSLAGYITKILLECRKRIWYIHGIICFPCVKFSTKGIPKIRFNIDSERESLTEI